MQKRIALLTASALILCLPFSCAQAAPETVPDNEVWVTSYDIRLSQHIYEKEGDTVEPQFIIDALKERSIMPVSVNVISYENGVLDLSKDFGEMFNMLNYRGRYELVSCVVNSFLDNYDLDELTITCEGNKLADDSSPFNGAMDYFSDLMKTVYDPNAADSSSSN